MKQTLFMKQLSKYFDTYLPQNKSCSKNTIASYADGFVVFFQFFLEAKGKKHYQISYSDMTPQTFDEFVLWMQNSKNYSAASQKQRLSALSSFLKYASRREMSALNAFNSISGASSPKIPRKQMPYFTHEEMKTILHAPKCSGSFGHRDTAILSLMYDSGARAQEVCDILIGDISLGKPSKVRLHGKGNKMREVPISNDVAKIIRKYLEEREKTFKENCADPLFPSQRSDKMTTACIRNLVRKYVSMAKEGTPNLFRDKGYSPHSFRHSKAVHMLEAGVPLIYIRNFLGHESVKTTELYLRINQESAAKILRERKTSNPIPHVTADKNTADEENIPAFLKQVR